jgi:hypothetical protein
VPTRGVVSANVAAITSTFWPAALVVSLIIARA